MFDLKGVRHAITVNAFPFIPSRLWLFLVLSSVRPGRYPSYVRVVNDKTDKIIFHAQLKPSPVFDASHELVPARSQVKCSFPEEGRYTIQVWFFQERGSDVLKGEVPFLVVKEVG